MCPLRAHAKRDHDRSMRLTRSRSGASSATGTAGPNMPSVPDVSNCARSRAGRPHQWPDRTHRAARWHDCDVPAMDDHLGKRDRTRHLAREVDAARSGHPLPRVRVLATPRPARRGVAGRRCASRRPAAHRRRVGCRSAAPKSLRAAAVNASASPPTWATSPSRRSFSHGVGSASCSSVTPASTRRTCAGRPRSNRSCRY